MINIVEEDVPVFEANGTQCMTVEHHNVAMNAQVLQFEIALELILKQHGIAVEQPEQTSEFISTIQ